MLNRSGSSGGSGKKLSEHDKIGSIDEVDQFTETQIGAIEKIKS
jgi:hypothetical protein